MNKFTFEVRIWQGTGCGFFTKAVDAKSVPKAWLIVMKELNKMVLDVRSVALLVD